MMPTQPPSTAVPNRGHTIDAPRTAEQAWHRSSEADLWLRIQAARALAASERQSRVATEAKLAAVEKALEAERQRRVAAEVTRLPSGCALTIGYVMGAQRHDWVGVL